MILIVLAAVLVLGIAFYQVTQGLYSAMIMAILSIVCATAALAFYEPLAAMLYDRQPAHADAGVLILLFVVPLFVLRSLSDTLLSGNVAMGAWIDRILGGAAGLLVGIVMVGVLMIAVQMLPLGRAPLGFSPYDDALQRRQRLAPFYPDEAVVGMVKAFSAGSLGGRPFSAVHDDLLLELFCARNQAEQTRPGEGKDVTDRGGRVDAKPGWLTVVGAYRLTERAFAPIKLEAVPDSPPLDKQANLAPNVIVVRVQVDEQARNEGDDWWRLPATHFRLVARDNEDRNRIKSHYPVAYLTGRSRIKEGKKKPTAPKPDQWRLHPAESSKGGLARIGALSVERPWVAEAAGGDPGNKLTVDWVYRIGRNETPAYVVFRRTTGRRKDRHWRVGAQVKLVDAAPPKDNALDRIEEVKKSG